MNESDWQMMLELNRALRRSRRRIILFGVTYYGLIIVAVLLFALS